MKKVTRTRDVPAPAILLALALLLALAMLLALAVLLALAIYSHTKSHHPTQSNQHLWHSRVWHRALASDSRALPRLLANDGESLALVRQAASGRYCKCKLYGAGLLVAAV